MITAFRRFDAVERFDRAVQELDRIVLSHKDDFFSFEFAALDYTNPDKTRYAYKLEGFDEDWVYSGTRRYASYTNLDGGTYSFRVKGTNVDGLVERDGELGRGRRRAAAVEDLVGLHALCATGRRQRCSATVVIAPSLTRRSCGRPRRRRRASA